MFKNYFIFKNTSAGAFLGLSTFCSTSGLASSFGATSVSVALIKKIDFLYHYQEKN